jgi:uncharacterized protein YecE (DUF72 family)
MHYFLGCPEWSRPEWKGSLLPTRTRPTDFLAGYARVFNTVEGNTTFYALPRPDVVERWKESTPPDFRFCFKFPRSISHDRKLENTTELTREFFERIAPLEERIGPIQLQLSADFGRNRWPQLQQFLLQLPSDFRYAVEVRNLAYFDEQKTEQELDTFLRQRQMARVLFDTHKLMASQQNDSATIEAKRRKPKVPVRFTVTNELPLLRFVGDPQNEVNYPVLRDWAQRVANWMRQGFTPFVFLHTPDDILAPQLARDFHGFLQEQLSELPPLPDFAGEVPQPGEQLSLF